MQRTVKRVIAATLLGLALALGVVGGGQLAQQPVMIANGNPGGGTGTGSGG